MTTNKDLTRVLKAVFSGQWAIERSALETIVSIAHRQNEDIEALTAKLGRPLKNTRDVIIRDGVAILPITGPVFRYASLFTEISGATSLAQLATDFQMAVDDPLVESIILEIDSPGGEVSGVSEFATLIRNSPKPVTAFAADTCASAAYWIASAANRVVACDTAMLGSIGVVMTFSQNSDDDRFEIVSAQSPNKRLDPADAEGKAEYQKIVDSLATVFVSTVATNRGVSEETVLTNFGKGGLLIGSDAVKAGMADSVGTLESLIAGFSGNQLNKGISMSDDNKILSSEITRDYVNANHPAVAEALRLEGAESIDSSSFIAQGAVAERERIQAVLGQSLPGHEKLIQGLAFDGKTTGDQAAVQVLAAEKAMRGDRLKSLQTGSAPVLDATDTDLDTFDASNASDEQLTAHYNENPKVRNEFLSAKGYISFVRNGKR